MIINFLNGIRYQCKKKRLFCQLIDVLTDSQRAGSQEVGRWEGNQSAREQCWTCFWTTNIVQNILLFIFQWSRCINRYGNHQTIAGKGLWLEGSPSRNWSQAERSVKHFPLYYPFRKSWSSCCESQHAHSEVCFYHCTSPITWRRHFPLVY